MKEVQEKYDRVSMEKSIKIIDDLLKDEIEALGDPSKVFLGGFSQGCALSLATFMQFKHGNLGGVLGLSGMHAYSLDLSEDQLIEKRKTPLFLYHGVRDPMVPWQNAKLTYLEFDRLGLNYDLRSEADLEHSLSLKELGEVRKFLREHMM